MYYRIILINLCSLAVGLFLSWFLVGATTSQSFAGESVEWTFKKKSKSPKVYDEHNVDYEFPTSDSKQFKDSKILQYSRQSMDMKRFRVQDLPAQEKTDLDQQLERFYIQDDRRHQAAVHRQRAIDQGKLKAYHEYLMKKQALQQQIDKELGPVLESLTITDEDVQMASSIWDES